jgi:hypothetical protein
MNKLIVKTFKPIDQDLVWVADNYETRIMIKQEGV